MTTTQTPIRQLGPLRAVGLSYIAGNGNFDFPGLWDRIMKTIPDLMQRPGASCFGLCRCIPGATDGTWEYIAAVEIPPAQAVPEGLIEVKIAQSDYVIIEVESLKVIGDAWHRSRETVAALKGHEPYCGPKGCNCATHPSFEHYTADFSKTGKLTICIPVKKV